MRIGFTGTRNGCTPRQLQALKATIYGLREAATLKAAHGGCKGADAQFHQLCLDESIDVDIYPGFFKNNPNDLSCRADLTDARKVYPAKPMLKRNDRIVEWADLIIACPPTDLSETRGGTYYTIRKAQEEGVQTIVLFP